jgi:hypothetical protein
VRHAAAVLLGGVVAGAAAGLAARLVMWSMRLANPAFNGATTHQGVENGRWTWSGTSYILATAIVVGVFGALLYLPLRPLLRGGPALRGLEFGFLAFVAFGGLVLDGSYEYVRFVSTWVAVAAFAAIYPWYGLVLGVVAGRVAPAPAIHHWPRATAVASAALGVAAVIGAVDYGRQLRFEYFT